MSPGRNLGNTLRLLLSLLLAASLVVAAAGLAIGCWLLAAAGVAGAAALLVLVLPPRLPLPPAPPPRFTLPSVPEADWLVITRGPDGQAWHDVLLDWWGGAGDAGDSPAAAAGRRFQAIVCADDVPLDAASLAALRGSLRPGGRLILDAPAPDILRALGLAAAGGEAAALQVRLPEGSVTVAGPLYRHVFAGGPGAPFTVDSTPALICPAADLAITAFSFARVLARWGAGRPPSAPARMRAALHSGLSVLTPAAFAAAPEADFPAATCLIRAAHRALLAGGAVPRLWPLPDGAPAAVVLTHDEDMYGAALLSLLDCEARHGAASTVFLMADSPLAGDPRLAAYQAQGFAFGLHWNRYPLHVVNRRPHWARHRSLAAQVAAVSSRSQRTHWLQWERDHAPVFAHLAAQGIGLDSTFGPGWGQKGFVFAAAHPYHPVSSAGRVPVWELPFHCMDHQGGSDFAWQLDLVVRSHAWQGYAVLLNHPHYLATADAAPFARLLHTLRGRGERFLTFTQIQDWLERRQQVRLAWTVEGRQLHGTASVTGSDQQLWLPGRPQAPVTCNGRPAAARPAAGGLLLPLPAGTNTFSIALAE